MRNETERGRPKPGLPVGGPNQLVQAGPSAKTGSEADTARVGPFAEGRLRSELFEAADHWRKLKQQLTTALELDQL